MYMIDGGWGCVCVCVVISKENTKIPAENEGKTWTAYLR